MIPLKVTLLKSQVLQIENSSGVPKFGYLTICMHWQKECVETFFGANLAGNDPMQEMRFEAGGMRYYLCLSEQIGWLRLTGDVRDPECAFPAMEVECECRHIEQTEASGVGPVLLFYASPDKRQEHLRLCITRDRGRFSISPHWQR